MRLSRSRLLGVLLLVGAVSAFARVQLDLRLPLPERGDWVVSDADSLYQLRRVERVFAEGLPVADTDPDLAWPQPGVGAGPGGGADAGTVTGSASGAASGADLAVGAPIQWPPGYPLLCWALLAPFAPADAAARGPWLEHAMGLLPLLFGVAGTLLAALGGALLAGLTGAFIAGGVHALAIAAISYGAWGNADYHAFAALLAGALPLLLAATLCGTTLASRTRALRAGALAGLLAGALWVTWLGAIHHVITLQAALGLLLCLERGERRAALAAWGAAFSIAALLLVLPCSLASPWLEAQPWSAEFMSWLQPALLLVGALLLLPAALAPASSALVRRWPALAALLLAGLVAALLLVENPVSSGLRAGLASATGAGAFAEIAESRPLIGEGVGAEELIRTLGPVGLLLPLCWGAAALAVWRGRRSAGRAAAPGADLALVPLLLSSLVLLVLSLLQRRFANELVLPMAVLTGWTVARWEPHLATRVPAALRQSGILRAVACLALVAALQAPTVVLLAREASGTAGPRFPERRLRAQHHLHEWLAAHTPQTRDYSVLATWGHGNSLLWVARRPDVATQFGYYLGEESRLAPARYFLADDPEAADARLAHHRSRYVVVNPPDPGAIAELAAMLGPEHVERLIARRADGAVALRSDFARTQWGRLLCGSGLLRLPLVGGGSEGSRGGVSEGGSGGGSGASAAATAAADALRDSSAAPATLRLVHVGEADARGATLGWIFERVPGALLEARAPPGLPPDTPLRVRVELKYPGLAHALIYEAEALPGADGSARVRVPYATRGDNGDGRAVAPASWSFGGAAGRVDIPEAAVQSGGLLLLEPAP